LIAFVEVVVGEVVNVIEIVIEIAHVVVHEFEENYVEEVFEEDKHVQGTNVGEPPEEVSIVLLVLSLVPLAMSVLVNVKIA
jgi:hypothetical protein